MDAKCRAVPIWDTQMPERDPFGDGSDGAHTARETREWRDGVRDRVRGRVDKGRRGAHVAKIVSHDRRTGFDVYFIQTNNHAYY